MTKLSKPDIRANLELIEQRCVEHGTPSPTTFVYPRVGITACRSWSCRPRNGMRSPDQVFALSRESAGDGRVAGRRRGLAPCGSRRSPTPHSPRFISSPFFPARTRDLRAGRDFEVEVLAGRGDRYVRPRDLHAGRDFDNEVPRPCPPRKSRTHGSRVVSRAEAGGGLDQ